jgi:SAM-dependent methyltransferase
MAGQTHTADVRVLNQRTLEKDHKRLAAFLRPGVSVLDIGCGSGAITAGIARRAGRVVGLDRDPALLAQARAAHPLENLTFVEGDVLTWAAPEPFDIVSAARVLQWISDPELAVRRMAAATRDGGWVVALDYNHANNRLEPAPGTHFAHFYAAFLAWRQSHGWENRIGDRLPELFEAAGLLDVSMSVEDEVTASTIWPHVIESLGPQMVADGAIEEPARLAALAEILDFAANGLRAQTLVLRAAAGRRR